ncbi:polyhydroxyalkanoate synthesis regulator DNA-binding domain-containing protein [Haliangium ochraceum]|uniref:PHA accumulation regulator DNA-binding protein n=1 Tax=Haliangium ochraceum (strain DSM 14365 / JCM 11303 / SMP-2) TaxID=502025 RepID=D0LYX5_HALO1|nr:polyhydroxyalkanoate synthesis regulator DNA-binding domain-containing protein [Haliangium ochraceum]ACY14445.1 PHA accumulation regulator DNA-binding protein [Haliangium ochraceum DSM 14365]
MTQARIIKRYANRKLYDTQHSRYVTLEQISEMIRHGDDVKIIDNKTKDDLTTVTLAQIIFEEEKKQRSFLSLQTMRNLIQNGGESFAQFVNEAQRRVTNMLPRKREDEDGVEYTLEDAEMAPASASASSEAEVLRAAGDEGSESRRAREGVAALRDLREWVEQSQRTIDDWHRRVDGRIRHVVEGFTPFAGVHKDVKILAERIQALESKLDRLAVEPDLVPDFSHELTPSPSASAVSSAPLDPSQSEVRAAPSAEGTSEHSSPRVDTEVQ